MAAPKPRKKNPFARLLAGALFGQRVVKDKKQKAPRKKAPKWRQSDE